MTSIDKTAILWTIAIVAIGVGIAGYGTQPATPVQTTSEIVKQSETQIVRELVYGSIDLYDLIGEDAFEQINTNDKFRNGDVYVFVLDKQGIRIAHGGNPDLIGLQTPNFPNNKIRDIILDSANEDGAWIKYQRALPDSHTVHTKNSFVVEHDDLIFGSGYYVEDKMASEKRSSAQYMVEQAIADYNARGMISFSDFNSSLEYHDGELYVFVVRMSDNVIASHGTSPEVIDRKITEFVDADGTNIGNLLVDNASVDGIWVQYNWENPLNNKVELKSSWIKLHDGYLFGVGIYE